MTFLKTAGTRAKPLLEAERVSDSAANFYRALSPERRARVVELVEYIRKYPEIDNIRIFPYRDHSRPNWDRRVLVESDFTIFFRAEGNLALIDIISETPAEVRKAALS
jgi:hypothetical protein